MRYYILPEKKEEYFCDSRRGICMKSTISKAEPKVIIERGTEDFGLYCDNGTHIICADRVNNILYSVNNHKPIVLLEGKKNVEPYDFTLTKAGGIKYMFYKTEYENEILLFCCTLDAESKPFALDKLSKNQGNYFVGYGRLLYTANDEALYERKFNKVGIGTSEKICDKGCMPYYLKDLSGEFKIYKREDKIILNGSVVAEDMYCTNPVVFYRQGKYYLQWKSGDFIRYMTSANGETWSAPMRYLGIKKRPHLICVVSENEVYSCYGYDGKPFSTQRQEETKNNDFDSIFRSELVEIKRQIQIIREEIEKLKH